MHKTRKLTLILALAGFCSTLLIAQSESRKASPPQTRLIVGYLPSFRLDRFPIKELETRGAGQQLTHILYAFANVANAHPTLDDDETEYQRAYSARESIDGNADNPTAEHSLRGAFNQLGKLKLLHSQLKVLI